MRLLIILAVLAAAGACNKNGPAWSQQPPGVKGKRRPTPAQKPARRLRRPDTKVLARSGGWPTDARGLVAHLNRWDKDELDVYERPAVHRASGRVASGETGGWITTHKDQLKKLGVHVRWHHGQKKYRIDLDRMVQAVSNRSIRIGTYRPKGSRFISLGRKVMILGPPEAKAFVTLGDPLVVAKLVPLLATKPRAWGAFCLLARLTGRLEGIINAYAADYQKWLDTHQPSAHRSWSGWHRAVDGYLKWDRSSQQFKVKLSPGLELQFYTFSKIVVVRPLPRKGPMNRAQLVQHLATLKVDRNLAVVYMDKRGSGQALMAQLEQLLVKQGFKRVVFKAAISNGTPFIISR